MTTALHPRLVTDADGVAARIAAALRSEVALARLAIGVVALHVVDDSFLQPNPGTSAADHLFGGLVPLALLVAAACSTRASAPARARRPRSSSGFFGVLGGTEAVHYALDGRPVGRRLHRAALDPRRARCCSVSAS